MDNNEIVLENLEKDDKENRRKRIWFLLLFLLLLFFATFGITYTLYKGDNGGNGSEIITDQIIFTYSDVDKTGNGIYIKEADPISDNVGKNMLGTEQYFDFSVTATSKSSKLHYKLLIKKGDDSTLSNDSVRIYLTSLTGNLEKQVILDTFSNLKKEKIDGQEYYVLYEKDLDKGISNYSDLYRLRMWVKEDAQDYDLKRFSLKVDVQAVQVGE